MRSPACSRLFLRCSGVLTAQYWISILDNYTQRKSGVVLELKAARNAPESNEATGRGEYDFVYSNTSPGPGAGGSPIQALKDLEGKEVGFPSLTASGRCVRGETCTERTWVGWTMLSRARRANSRGHDDG